MADDIVPRIVLLNILVLDDIKLKIDDERKGFVLFFW